MVHIHVLLLSLVVIYHGNSASTSVKAGCTTADKEPGDCRNLKNCSALVKLLQQKQPAAISQVKQAICGFEDLEPLVCCPEPSVYSKSPVEAPQHTEQYEECGRGYATYDKVVGGEDAELGDWPWLAALGYQTPRKPEVQWLCGGALITRRHIITAAHCVPSDMNLTVARLGDLNLDDRIMDKATPVDMQVDKTIPHPDYTSQTKLNDIAIVQLKTPVPLNENIWPICLPNTLYFKSTLLSGEVAKVAGWGKLSFGGLSTSKLQQVELKIVDDKSCRNAYRDFQIEINNDVMCAGTPGKSACQGDSGGPLVLFRNSTYYLVGVVSYGKGCGEPGFPGVATRVSSFVEWIATNLN